MRSAALERTQCEIHDWSVVTDSRVINAQTKAGTYRRQTWTYSIPEIEGQSTREELLVDVLRARQRAPLLRQSLACPWDTA